MRRGETGPPASPAAGAGLGESKDSPARLRTALRSPGGGAEAEPASERQQPPATPFGLLLCRRGADARVV